MTGKTDAARKLLDGLGADEVADARRAFDILCQKTGLQLGSTFDDLRAGRSLADALGLPEGTAALLYDRAYRLILSGRGDKAAPLFRVLCLIGPHDAKHWLGFGLCEFREGRHLSARDAFAEAIRHAPRWAVAHFHAADLAVRSGEWSEAEIHLDRFETADKGDVPNKVFQEVERLKLAIDLARQRASAGGTSG